MSTIGKGGAVEPSRLARARALGAARLEEQARPADGVWVTPYLAGAFHDLVPSIALNQVGVQGDEFFQEDREVLLGAARQQTPSGGFPLYVGDKNGSSVAVTELFLTALKAAEGNGNESVSKDLQLQAARQRAEQYLQAPGQTDETYTYVKIADVVKETAAPTGRGVKGFAVFRPSLATSMHHGILRKMGENISAPLWGVFPALAILTQHAWDNSGSWLNGVIHRASEGQRKFLREEVLKAQDPNGGWLYFPTITALNVMALKAVGKTVDDPEIGNGVKFIRGLRQSNGDGTRTQRLFASEIWDTACGGEALLENGHSAKEPLLHASIDTLIREQTADGRWSFALQAPHLPDTDDTGMVVRFLAHAHRSASPEQQPAIRATIARAVQGMLAHQQADGGWNAWMPTTARWGNKRPVSTTAVAYDCSTPDVTGRVLGSMGMAKSLGLLDADLEQKVSVATGKAVEYLQDAQHANGSWWSRWSAGYVTGAGFVLAGLRAAGVDCQQPWIQKGREFLLQHQNSDGGWGETVEMDSETEMAGKGASTPTHTSLAIQGLLATSADARGTELARAATYLANTQDADGGWNNGSPIFTNIPQKEYYESAHLTRFFALDALSLYQASLDKGVDEALRNPG